MKERGHSNVKFVIIDVPKSHLNQHVATIHEGKNPFKCETCECSYSQKSHFNQDGVTVHEKIKHTNVKLVITGVLKTFF